MRIWVMAGTLAALLAALVIGLILMAGRHVEMADFAETPDASPPADLPASLSRISVPVSIPMTEIARLANTTEPMLSGVKKNPVRGDRLAEDQLEWRLTRSAITAQADDGGIALAATIAGNAFLTGQVNLGGGKLGKLLGGGGMPLSAQAALAADLQARMAPRFQSDWSLEPGLVASARLSQAEIPIAGLASLSLRAVLQPVLDKAVERAVTRANRSMGSPKRLRDLVDPLWLRLCQIKPMGQHGLWLLSTPVGVGLSQPRVDDTHLHLGLVLEARLSALSAPKQPPQPECPKLPGLLTLSDAPADGTIALRLPGLLDWGWVAAQLDLIAAGRAESGREDRVAFRNVTIQPTGDRLLLGGDMTLRGGGLLSPVVKGRVWVSAQARLDRDSGRLHFDDIRIAPASEGALSRLKLRAVDAVLAYWGARGMSVDLARIEADALARADERLSEAMSTLAHRAQVSSTVESVRLEQVAVAREGLVLTLSANGRVAVDDLTLGP